MASFENANQLNGHFLVEPWRTELDSRTRSRSTDIPVARPSSEDSIQHQTHRLPNLSGGHGGALNFGVKPELLLDEGNLLPFHFLRVGDRIGRAVVKIQRDDGATGTGFLVASDILLTNHHVLPDEETAAGAVALANYEVNPPNDATGRAVAAPLDPHTMFVTNADLDFTFCGVRGLDFLGTVQLDRDQMKVDPDEIVNIIQHPRGRPKEVVLRDNWVVRADSVVLHYSCDTEPGSSGSPVFNNAWKPVALHHASVLTDSPEGRAVTGDDSGRYINEGIRLSAIALWLETEEAASRGRRDQVARLRALFGGLNGKVGFFGALGRRAHGQTAHELVAESYRGAMGMLDVGYWNTRPLGGLPLERIGEIARVVAEMGLDIWCFTHADSHAVDVLRRVLRSTYRMDYESVRAGTETHPSPVFLHRKLDDLRVERETETPTECDRCAHPGECRDHPPAPSIIRVTAKRTGGRAEPLALRLVAVARPSDLDDHRERLADGDRLLMGDASLLQAEAAAGVDAVPAEGESGEGAFLWIGRNDSLVEHLYATPNIKTDPTHARMVTNAGDRGFPRSLAAMSARPIALRLCLREQAADEVTVEPPRDDSREADELERRIRKMIEPILADLLRQLKDEFKRSN